MKMMRISDVVTINAAHVSAVRAEDSSVYVVMSNGIEYKVLRSEFNTPMAVYDWVCESLLYEA